MIPQTIWKRWLPGMAVLTAAALCYGCPGKSDSGDTPTPPSAAQTGQTPSGPKNPDRVAQTLSEVEAATKAITDLQAAPDSPLPKGTRLLQMEVRDGVAYLNFNKEFNALANSGESVESQAQKALRKALAPYASIQKMSVKVEGKPFESQATDWATPFPVRDEGGKPGPERKAGGDGVGP